MSRDRSVNGFRSAQRPRNDVASVGLRTNGLRVTYGNAVAVRGASIGIPGGKVTALTGPNGAGKSSLLLALYGSVSSSGEVLLGDSAVSHLSNIERAKRGISIVPQGRQLFPRLTVLENLRIMAQTLRLDSSEVDAALERFPILVTRAGSLAGVLSGGEQQMLVVSRALMGSPSVLLLDEVFTGLAPVIVEEIGVTVSHLKDQGVAVLLAGPEIGAALSFIDRGYVMLRGELVACVESNSNDLDKAYQRAMGVELAESLSDQLLVSRTIDGRDHASGRS